MHGYIHVVMQFFNMLKIDNLIENISGYIDTRLELFKIEIKEWIAKILSNLIYFLILLMLILVILIFISMSAGFYLNQILESNFWGFGIVASFYLLIVILFILNSKKNIAIINSQIQKIIEKKLKKEEKD